MTAKIQATNTFVLVIRDEVKTEMGGLSIPDSAKKKPSIVSTSCCPDSKLNVLFPR